MLPNIESEDQLKDLVTLLYRVNKHSLALPCHDADTEAVVHRNMRMGIGVTGYLQATEEQKSWLASTYDYLRDYDEGYSEKNNWPISIKLTTCKPSGTLSLLPGVTPGVHPAFAQYMIRRVRIASNSPLVDLVKDHGYPVEFVRNFDGSVDRSTVVAEFPMSVPEGTPLAKDMTAIDQLEAVRRLQSEWSDNSVSCTVYYEKEELPAIREYLAENYDKNFKTLSFLPRTDHGFDQAPLEEITKEEYDKRVAKSRPIGEFVYDLDLDLSTECENGACPVR